MCITSLSLSCSLAGAQIRPEPDGEATMLNVDLPAQIAQLQQFLKLVNLFSTLINVKYSRVSELWASCAPYASHFSRSIQNVVSSGVKLSLHAVLALSNCPCFCNYNKNVLAGRHMLYAAGRHDDFEACTVWCVARRHPSFVIQHASTTTSPG